MNKSSSTMLVPEAIRPYVRQLIYLHQIGQAHAALEQIRNADNYQDAIAKIPASSETAIAS